MNYNFETLYEKNMEKVKSISTDMYIKIVNTDISHVSLDIHEQGINIIVNDEPLYPKNVSEAISNQVANFILRPKYIFRKPTKTEADEVWKLSLVHDKYCTQLQSYSPIINKKLYKFKGYETPFLDIPFMLLFGIGSGQHIKELLTTHKEIHNLMIFDTDFVMLKISFHIIDWCEIFDYFSKQNKQISIFVSNNAEDLALTFINHIYLYYPFIFTYVQYYMHYSGKFFDEILSYIQERSTHGLKGWGFYDDSYTSLIHTINTIKKRYPVFSNHAKLKSKSRVFIVASGPSVDNDIEFIKQNTENAIIFSCGSALKILEKNNIKPDYHFEIERSDFVYNALTSTINKEFLKEINFIGLNVIYPKVFELFKKSFVWYRANDAGAYLSTKKTPKFEHSNPTVTNGAFAFASYIGFDEIYLFGCDMGFKSIETHHSKDTAYYEGKANDIFINAYTKEIHQVKANFESTGTLQTDYYLSWAKLRIENCIKDVIISNHQKVYNCSDGAYIDGTISKSSSQLFLDTINKRNIKKELEANFSNIESKSLLIANFNKQLEILNTTTNKILDICNNSTMDSLKNILYAIFSINSLIKNHINDGTIVYSVLTGTVTIMLNKIYGHSLAMGDNDETYKFAQLSFNTIGEFVNFANLEIQNLQKQFDFR